MTLAAIDPARIASFEATGSCGPAPTPLCDPTENPSGCSATESGGWLVMLPAGDTGTCHVKVVLTDGETIERSAMVEKTTSGCCAGSYGDAIDIAAATANDGGYDAGSSDGGHDDGGYDAGSNDGGFDGGGSNDGGHDDGGFDDGGFDDGGFDGGGSCPGPGGFACVIDADCCSGQFCRNEGDGGLAPYCSACRYQPGNWVGPCSQGGESCAAPADCPGGASATCNVPAGQSVGTCG